MIYSQNSALALELETLFVQYFIKQYKTFFAYKRNTYTNKILSIANKLIDLSKNSDLDFYYYVCFNVTILKNVERTLTSLPLMLIDISVNNGIKIRSPAKAGNREF